MLPIKNVLSTWQCRRVMVSLLMPLLVAVQAGCSAGANLPPLPEAKEQPYRLGPSDQIRIITFGGDQLTGEFRVNDAGNVAIPLLGTVPAVGRTTADLGEDIAQRLKQSKLFQDPNVSVEITSYRPVFVLGEVSHPGQYPYQPGMTVLSAVTVAGGFSYRAVTDYSAIVRNVDGHPMEGRAQRLSYVEPGDVLTVFERHF